MKYANTVTGTFLDRPNRFIAHVEIEGNVETVHVKNTGRCRELLLPGATVVLTDHREELRRKERKTGFDLIAVYREGSGWINIDSQAPNVVVKEWLCGENDFFPGLTLLRPEYRFGNSRVDFYLEQGERKILLEVKGCTLEIGGEGYFPDAPTKRGVRHLSELSHAVKEGYEAYLAFVIAMNGVRVVHPAAAIHPEFAEALSDARKAGVRILYLECEVKSNGLRIIRAAEQTAEKGEHL